MGFIKRTIKVEEQIIGTGAKCSNPKIEWDQPLCAGITCKRNNGREIDVVIPDDCTEKCFWVTYTCNDYCQGCDPIRLRICPCTSDTECDGCSDCDPVYGVCVSRCAPGEFCTDHDTCVECDENTPCKNGKQCVGGHCECPPEKPYINKHTGDCAACNDESCPPGEVCTPDGCQPPVCPSGHWLASEEKCVECINTGHCDPGECCNPVTHKCDCCPGFARDPVTKVCVKAPCTEDSECPECMYCQTGVGCVPQICPEGQICIPGKGCVPECNCDNPNCTDPSSACVSYSADKCYCNKCTGSCANGQECGEGCYCDPVDLQCKPKPCSSTPCTDGSECGKGCGCNPDTRMCEPCSSADCGDECDKLLGCECRNEKCADVNGCDGPCDGYGTCAPGCTCDDGWCVPCADFSCETDDCSDHPECQCNGSKCEGNPDFCTDTFEADDFDCGVGAALTLKNGCMCHPLTAYVTAGSIVKDIPFLNARPAKHLVGLSIRLAKGAADNWGDIKQLHLLDEVQYDDIADNDTPISGSINLTIKQVYQPQVWVNNAWVNNGPLATEILPGGGNISFAGIARIDNFQFTAHKIGIGYDVIDGVSQKKSIRYEVSVRVNQMTFENNCVYQAKDIPTITFDAGIYKQTTDSLDATSLIAYWDTFIHPANGNFDLGSRFVENDTLGSTSKRNPLLTWFRSEDNIYSKEDIIRKLYKSPDSAGGTLFSDYLYGPKKFDTTKQDLVSPEGRVFGDMYYMVTNDCSCDERVLDFGNMKWCSPESMILGNILFSDCNKKVEIKSDISEPCPTNWDLNSFDLHASDNTTAFKNKHQAKYHLMITLENGSKIDTPYIYRQVGTAKGLYSETGGVSIKAYNQTFTSPIVGLKLELRYGTSTEVVCEWEKTIPAAANFVPTYTTTCLAGGKIAYRFLTTINHIVGITAVGGVVNSGTGYKEVVANVGQEATVYITFSDYCPATMTLNGDCCDTLAITVARTEVDDTTELTSVITGGVSPFSVKYYRQPVTGSKELVGESSNSANAYKLIMAAPTPGLYFGEVTDANGCVRESSIISIDPRDSTDYAVTINPLYNGCAYTGNVAISIPQQPDVVGGKIYYRVDTGAEQYFTITNSMYSAGQHLLPATNHTVTLIKLEVPNTAGPATEFALSGSASVPANLNEAIPYVSTFTINGSSPSATVCGGEEVLLEIQGSANAIVNIDTINPIYLDGSGYGSSAQTPTVSKTYTITSITNSNGECPGTQGVGLARQASVLNVPAITVVSDLCDGTLSFRTVTFNNITSATDQNGNALLVSGNSVTVQVGVVTTIHALYISGGCSTPFVHPVVACDAPTITGTISGPDVICEGESATITVSGVTGGTSPYSYNYYTDTDYNETYVLNQTSKVLALTATSVVTVRVMDALGNISIIGTHTVTVATSPTPNIIPITGQIGVTETSDNVFEIDDNITDAVFKTEIPYSTYAWLVTGTYGGTTSGSGSTFTIDPAQITGTIQLQVTVTTSNGCVGVEIVFISVVTAPVLIAADELLFTTSSYKLMKVQVSASTVGIPSQVCPAGNPAYGLALRGNGELIGMLGATLYELFPLSGCGNTLIGSFSNVVQGIAMLTANKVVAQTTNKLQTYDLSNDTVNTNHYTISDGSNSYSSASALVKIGTKLYSTCARSIAGVLQDYVLLEFTLDVNGAVTAFANLGATANQAGNSGVGLAYDGTDAYMIFLDGKVYLLDLGTPSASTFIGTIVVPMAEGINDVTNNY